MRALFLCSCVLLLVVVGAFPCSARGVLLERPSGQVGAPMYPDRPVRFYVSTYDFEGVEVEVYYTDAELEAPEVESVRLCGGEELAEVADPDFSVRFLQLEGERVFFLWDDDVLQAGDGTAGNEAGGTAMAGEFDLCRYIQDFAERYRFFATEFPERMRDRLPAVLEREE